MKTRTYMSTDWIEVHVKDSVYMAKVFLTGKSEAYMVTIQDGKKRLFKVDANLLRSGELGFFDKVMEHAEELPSQSFEIGLLEKDNE